MKTKHILYLAAAIFAALFALAWRVDGSPTAWLDRWRRSHPLTPDSTGRDSLTGGVAGPIINP